MSTYNGDERIIAEKPAELGVIWINILSNLDEIARNVYVSKNDSQHLQKYLQYNPYDDNGYVALGIEYKAKGDFLAAKKMFLKALSINPNNSKAEMYLDTIGSSERGIIRKNKISPFAKYTLAVLLVILLFLLLNRLLSEVFLSEKQKIFHNSRDLSYEIINSNELGLHILVPSDYSQTDLVKLLHAKAEQIFQTQESGSLEAFRAGVYKPELVSTVPEDAVLYGKITWGSESENALIYLYDNYSQFTLEVNIIRNSLLNYYKRFGTFPQDINDLAGSFPNNFLSPFELKYNYRYNPSYSFNNLDRDIINVFSPNTPVPFEPINIVVDKDRYKLFYLLGNKVYQTYDIGLGENNSTPLGEFKIKKRVAFPKPGDLFGIRGLELSNPEYAIHGTYDDNSIDKNFSLGCVRMRNPDIEELYALTPIGTPVSIKKTTDLLPKNIPLKNLFNKNQAYSSETTNQKFSWKS